MNLRKVFGFAIATFAVAAAVYFVTPAIDTLANEVSQTASPEENPGSGSTGTETGSTGTETGSTGTETGSTETGVTPSTGSTDTQAELVTSTTVNATPAQTQQEINHNRRAAAAAAAANGSATYAGAESTYVAANGVTVSQFSAANGSQGLVAGAPGVIPSGTKVYTDTIDTTSPVYTVASTLMSYWKPNASVVNVISANAQTTDGSWLSTLDGAIAMSVPVPADLVIPEGKALHVYKFLPDGSIELCETIIDNGRVVWGTDSFATFAFVVE